MQTSENIEAAGQSMNQADISPALEVKNLSFAYGTNQVLKGTSLSITEGKITTIMGANGCGKSTLFYLMTKNLLPGKGKILLKGKNIQNIHLTDFARKVSIVNQYNTSANDVTVEREVGRLSGGQRQRVWIAMALAQNTKILFLDEPTTYLDIRYQLDILRLIQKLNQEYGITIIMVLHDINQAIHYSDCVIGLKDGQVIVAGAADEVVTTESISQMYGIRLDVTKIEGKKFVLTA